jgi:hypothetical protein
MPRTGQRLTTPVGFALRLTRAERELFHAVARKRETTLSELTRALLAAEAVSAGVMAVPVASPAT